MLADFCTRLAFGMTAALLLLSPQVMHPRFYRTNLLTALGLFAAAAATVGNDPARLVPLLAATTAALLASVAWTLEPPPLGRTLLAMVLVLGGIATSQTAPRQWTWDESGSPVLSAPVAWDKLAEPFSAGLFLGVAVTAMLVGHSYLISPGLSIAPLMRMSAALFVTLAVRFVLAGVDGWERWTARSGWPVEVSLWLPVRWVVGLFAPLGFGWMAYQTARIHSTQSATGILYVVVVCAFLGELMALLLAAI